MNTDIRVNIGLVQHPKYKKMKRQIKKSPMEYLITFWGYVATYMPTGVLSGWTQTDIEDAASWDGKAGIFVKALIDCGFIDEVEDGYYPHDWNEHQTWVVKSQERSEKAKKAIAKRWDTQSNTASNTTSIDLVRTNVDTPSPSPSPSPSPLPKPLPEESKSSSSSYLIPLEQKAMMTINDFRFLFSDNFKTAMPPGCNQLASELCQHYPRDAIIEAFRIAAEQGKNSVAYVKGVLMGNGKAKAASCEYDPAKDYEPGSYFDLLKQEELRCSTTR